MPARSPNLYFQTVIRAADFLSRGLLARASEQPRVAVILGSGLGEFADTLKNREVLPFSAVPHFPLSSLGRLGIRRAIVTNAAGGINPRFRPGDLMLIRDHISLFCPNPLIGPNEASLGPRFPDMSATYSEPLRGLARRCARRLKFTLKEGVYVNVTGPSYESPAEIAMLKRLGADAVGMSTVPEVIVARHMGIECLGISNITNAAAGISKHSLSHSEVLKAGERVKPRFMALIGSVCERMSELG